MGRQRRNLVRHTVSRPRFEYLTSLSTLADGRGIMRILLPLEHELSTNKRAATGLLPRLVWRTSWQHFMAFYS